MENNSNSIKITVRTIAQGALIITFIILCFLFIRGVINILNSVLVTLAIYFFSLNKPARGIIVFLSALFVVCILFFSTQIIFLTLYFLISQILVLLKRLKWHKIISILALTIFNSIAFWGAIVFTDLIFGLRINQFMLTILNGNILLYIALLIAEGFFSGLILIVVSDSLYKRLVNINSESSPGA